MGIHSRVKRKKGLRKNKGFTLIEVLVVIGILAIVLAITLTAINPAEQASHAKDITAKATVEDFIKANSVYYSEKKALPWQKNTNCLVELSLGGTLDTMPHCVSELAQSDDFKDKYIAKDVSKEIRLNKCGDSGVICYRPKSKEEYSNATYDKFGVNDPGCPGHDHDSKECYWCKPIMGHPTCVAPTTTPIPTTLPSPTPTMTPSPTQTPTPTPTLIPSPTPTAVPTPTEIPTPTFTPTPTIPQVLSNYRNDDSKFFQTYAFYFFDHPGFPPTGAGWNMHISLRPDFGGDYTQTYKSFGIPSHYSQDAPLNISYAALRKITSKYGGITSITKGIYLYDHGCGKTIYWRIANYYNDSATDKKVGPTYTGVIDCTTKVGIVDPPLSWYTVYDQMNSRQKMYDASWDHDKNGVIDWTDYWLGAFSTKNRAGGWQPPE